MNAAIANLEKTIDTETAAARAALKVALQHAANVGRAYGAVRDLLTQSEVQAWLTSTTCADRHTIMSMRRISMCDLDTKARTLADLMFDRAAEHIAQGARGRSRSENIEINRQRMMAGSCGRPRNAPAAFIHPCQPIVAKQPPYGPWLRT